MFERAKNAVGRLRDEFEQTRKEISEKFEKYRGGEAVSFFTGVFVSLGVVWVVVALNSIVLFGSWFEYPNKLGDYILFISILFILSIIITASNCIGVHFGRYSLQYVFRDLMVRFLTLLGGTIVILSLGLQLVYFYENHPNSLLFADMTFLFLVLCIMSIYLVYTIRSIIWLRAGVRWFWDKVVKKFLPPHFGESWHIPPPMIEREKGKRKVTGYTAIPSSEITRRDLRKAFKYCISFFTISLGLVFVVVSVLNYTEIGYELGKAVTENRSRSIIEDFSAIFTIPPFFTLGLMEQLNIDAENLLENTIIFFIPFLVLLVSVWNFTYISEELHYRFFSRSSRPIGEKLLILSLSYMLYVLIILFVIGVVLLISPLLSLLTIPLIAIFYALLPRLSGVYQ